MATCPPFIEGTQTGWRLSKHRRAPPPLGPCQKHESHFPFTDTSRILRPYLRSYLLHHGNSQGGLGLSVYREGANIALRVGVDGRIRPESKPMRPFMEILIFLVHLPPTDLPENAILDLIADTPQEKIDHLHTCDNPAVMEDVYAQLPNLRTLHLTSTALSAPPPKPNANQNKGLPLSLRHVVFEGLVAD